MTVFCDLACRFPSVVAMMLEQEKNLVRGRFREESFTDLLAASLSMLDRPELRIAYPPESPTGGDLDLCYWDRRTGERLTVRLQAKRLSPAIERNRQIGLDIRRYDHLDHVVRGTGRYQYKTLIRQSGSVVPLYAFYNHYGAVQESGLRRLRPVVEGVNLAFATDIGRELDRHLRSGSRRQAPRRSKRLVRLQPYFFSLTRLFCAAHRGVPRPIDIARNLRRTFEDFGVAAISRDDRRLLIPSLEEGSQQFPSSYMKGRPAFWVSERVERPTILFISGEVA